MRYALDTGYFLDLLDGSGPWYVERVWREIRAEEADAVISGVTLFELERLGLKGVIGAEQAVTLTDRLAQVVEIRWMDTLDVVRSAAKFGQGHDLSMADSLILESALQCGADELYTTDSDLESYSGDLTVVHLRSGDDHPRWGSGPS